MAVQQFGTKAGKPAQFGAKKGLLGNVLNFGSKIAKGVGAVAGGVSRAGLGVLNVTDMIPGMSLATAPIRAGLNVAGTVGSVADHVGDAMSLGASLANRKKDSIEKPS